MQMPPRFLPKYATSVQPQPPREASGYRGYQGYDTSARAQPQSVAEILSSPLGEVPPDLAGLQQGAGSQRQIADMLTQRAMGRQPTGIVDGLASLGEAFLARGAIKKADTADQKYQQTIQALTQQALGEGPGAQSARATILASLNDPMAAMQFKIGEDQRGIDNKRADAGLDLQRRGVGLQEKGLEYDMLSGDRNYGLAVQGHELATELGRGGLGVQQGNLDLGWAELEAEKDKAEAEANAAPEGPEFGEVWRMRDAFEKRAQGFEESQRQYYMMQDLAKDATGASDVALGFAFFKTIDPSSTVREGEFAQAASSMGLGASMVQMFSRLDKGEKFSPQLRQELLKAASRAYEQQATDIQGLYQREGQFAGQYGVDPSLVVRNPVRQQGGDGTVFKGGVTARIPDAAVQELMSDPSPETMREFDAYYGEGQAQKLLASKNRAPSRIIF